MALCERSLSIFMSVLKPESCESVQGVVQGLKGCSQPLSQGSLLPVGERTWERGWAVLT